MFKRRVLRHILQCASCDRLIVDVAAPCDDPLVPYSVSRLINLRITPDAGTRCCGSYVRDLGAFMLIAPWDRENDIAVPPREYWHAADCQCAECAEPTLREVPHE